MLFYQLFPDIFLYFFISCWLFFFVQFSKVFFTLSLHFSFLYIEQFNYSVSWWLLFYYHFLSFLNGVCVVLIIWIAIRRLFNTKISLILLSFSRSHYIFTSSVRFFLNNFLMYWAIRRKITYLSLSLVDIGYMILLVLFVL